MVKQKNTLARIDKKCNEFDKALASNDEKNMLLLDFKKSISDVKKKPLKR